MSYQVKTPIYFVIFNRPEHTARVWETIRAVRPSRLFIAADGPRTPEEAERCAAARRVTEQVDWECDVQRDYAETNMGLVPRIVSGYRWAFAQVDRVIFMEDDVLLDPSFFPYCDELMERYADDPRVMAVTSQNLTGGASHKYPYSYYFSRYNLFAAIGVWRRTYALFSEAITGWDSYRETDWLKQRLRDPILTEYLHAGFDRILFQTVDAQDTRLMYHIIANDGYVIVPKVNLLNNTGYDGSGTHPQHSTRNLKIEPASPLAFPLAHPPAVTHHVAADRALALRFMQLNARGKWFNCIPYTWRRQVRLLLHRIPSAWRQSVRQMIGLPTRPQPERKTADE